MNKLNTLSIAFCVLFLFFNIYVISEIFINYPFSDDFGAILIFLIEYFKTYGFLKTLELLFSQGNDFRLLVLHLITLGDYFLFGNINFTHLRILGFTFLLGCLCFLFKIGKFERSKFYFFLPVPLLLISFHTAEIHALAMESLSHFAVIFFAITTFYFLLKKDKMVLPIIILFFGVFSNGNGLLIIPIGALGLILKSDFKRLMYWSIFSFFYCLIFFVGYQKGTINDFNFSVFKRILFVFPIYLGGIGGLESIKFNQMIGFIGIALSFYFLVYKKSFVLFPTKSAMLLFHLGTFFLISAKREYADAAGLLRGAYLINSIFIFILFYILFYQIHLSKWEYLKKNNRLIYSFGGIMILCFAYQARNYTKWIKEFGAQKNAINSVMAMVNGNTKVLYKDAGLYYNQPINRRWAIDTLIKNGVFDNSNELNSLVIKPLNLSISKINGSFDNAFEILSVDGLQIPENPYISISAKVKSYLKSPFNAMGLVLIQNNKRTYFELPLKNDRLFFLKIVEGRDYFIKFMIPKRYLNSDSFNLSFLKFQNKNVFISKFNQQILWNVEKYSKEKATSPLTLNHLNQRIDSLTDNKFYEAYCKNNTHKIVLEVNTLQANNTNYLEFIDPLSPVVFQLELKKESSKTKEIFFSASLNDKRIAKFLKNKDSVFKLSMLSKNSNNEFTSYPLKSLYFFKFN